MTGSELVELLRPGLSRFGKDRDPVLADRLAAFIELLAQWNRTYNLTAVRDPAAMVSRHVFDSLAVDPWLTGPRVADVGTGAGLPGLPLAMLRPELRFTVLDAAGKRVRFVRHAIARLGLDNVEVVHGRAEDHDPGAGFDTVLSRAFSTLGEFVATAGHLRAADGLLLAMKGTLQPAELAALPPAWRIAEIGRVDVPGLDAERHAVMLQGPPTDGPT